MNDHLPTRQFSGNIVYTAPRTATFFHIEYNMTRALGVNGRNEDIVKTAYDVYY